MGASFPFRENGTQRSFITLLKRRHSTCTRKFSDPLSRPYRDLVETLPGLYRDHDPRKIRGYSMADPPYIRCRLTPPQAGSPLFMQLLLLFKLQEGEYDGNTYNNEEY
jgi:hypothetical protein